MDELRIGVLGYGTVGLGTVRLLLEHAELLRQRSGVNLRLVRIVTRTPEDHRGLDLTGVEMTDDPARVVDADDVDLVVELFGGYEPARTLVKRALERGRHVVTANKALIAVHGNELLQVAADNGCELLFEAAVAGAVPVIKALKESLAANRVDSLYGILNGTCNYILTEMREKGLPFEQVLADAQAKGYAEADPTFDVDGIDAAHKLAILASIAFGMPLSFDKLGVEGIRNVSEVDIAWATEMGYRVKLLGIAKRTEEGLELRVQPTMVPASSMVAAVEGVFNAVFIHGDYAGTTMYYGRGAGERPTASAVVADVVEIARNRQAGRTPRVAALGAPLAALKALPVLAHHQLKGEYYLRLAVEDRPGVLADITHILHKHRISIDAIVQRQRSQVRGETVPLVLVTHETTEDRIQSALADIDRLETVRGKPHMIRIEKIPS